MTFRDGLRRIRADDPETARLAAGAGHAEISLALRAAATGHAMFDPGVARRLADAMSRPAGRHRTGCRTASPSGRPGCSGRSPPAVPTPRSPPPCFVAEATVKTHINAFAEMGGRNRTEAARYAIRHGFGS
ncbi:hypothetical protein [Actinoplanes xinjiangensis]|uniref:hypothetical protein n=1 Tax=Actinoplanes xinjiangensis TaxID=512350 RepID=UPI003439C419